MHVVARNDVADLAALVGSSTPVRSPCMSPSPIRSPISHWCITRKLADGSSGRRKIDVRPLAERDGSVLLRLLPGLTPDAWECPTVAAPG